MAQCEDFPCCGHTDGLGCDWVSPNEIVPCNTCFEARASYPYHNGYSCPTARRKAEEALQANIPVGATCQYEHQGELCGEPASVNSDNEYFCNECWHELEATRDKFDRLAQEQYDDYWHRY